MALVVHEARTALLIVCFFDVKKRGFEILTVLGMHGFPSGIHPPSSWRHRRACIMGALWYALIFLAGLAFAAYMVPLPDG